jgi:hypothetical protein
VTPSEGCIGADSSGMSSNGSACGMLARCLAAGAAPSEGITGDLGLPFSSPDPHLTCHRKVAGYSPKLRRIVWNVGSILT